MRVTVGVWTFSCCEAGGCAAKTVGRTGEAESSRRFSSSTEPADHSGDHSFNQFGSITVSSAGKSVISPSSKKDMSWLIKSRQWTLSAYAQCE